MFGFVKKNLLKIIFGAALAVTLVFSGTHMMSATPAFAQTNTTKPTNGDNGGFVLCGNTANEPCTIDHLFAAFIVIINYLIAMAGFVAVAAIVLAGFTMIYSQGQDDLKAAKGRFSGAIIGLVLVAAAYLIINSLISGRFSVGICDDQFILTSPLEYIKNYESCQG